MLVALTNDAGLSDRHEMERDNEKCLEALIEIEDLLPLMATESELRGDKDRALSNALLAFRTALPFTEAERGWIGRVYSAGASEPSARVIALIEASEGTVMSVGIRTVVRGSELMHRWQNWRRQTGAFEGQDGMIATQEALAELIRVLAPAEPPEGSDRLLP